MRQERLRLHQVEVMWHHVASGAREPSVASEWRRDCQRRGHQCREETGMVVLTSAAVGNVEIAAGEGGGGTIGLKLVQQFRWRSIEDRVSTG